MRRQGLVAIVLLVLLVFLIPVERIYDQFLRHFSKSLIPEGIHPHHFDKKIALYITEVIILSLLALLKVPFKRSLLWGFFCAIFLSIPVSPYANYPLPYLHLLHLFAPLALVPILSYGLNDEEKGKATHWMLIAICFAGLFEALLGIAQYFHQAPIGLRFLNESKHIIGTIPVPNQSLWLLDPFFGIIREAASSMRASGTLPHPNPYGGFMFFSLLCTYPLPKRFYFTIPFQLFALFLSFSRSALIAWMIGSVIYFFYQRNKTLFWTLLSSVTLSSALLFEQLIHRGSVVKAITAPDEIRLYYQNLSLKIIQDHPFFGLGYTQYFEQVSKYFQGEPALFTAPHNIFLFLACETGLVSLTLFLLFLVQLLYKAVRNIHSPQTAAFFALLIGFLFIGCCDFYPLLCQPGRMMFFLTIALLQMACNRFEKTGILPGHAKPIA